MTKRDMGIDGRPRAWTAGDDSHLRARDGHSVENTAKCLGRYPGDVRRRARELGVHLIDRILAPGDGRATAYPDMRGVDVARVLSRPWGQATYPGRAGRGVG